MSHIHTYFMVSCFAILISSTCAYYNYDEEQPTVVIDISSNLVISGWAGDDAPRSIIDIDDSTDMSQVLGTIFYNVLRVEPEQTKVFMTVDMNASEEDKDTLTEIIFATYGVPQFYLANDAAFALYSSGSTTGLVVLIEEEYSWFVPVYQNNVITDAVTTLDIGKSHLVDYMVRILHERAYDSITTEIGRDIMEKLAYVALDFEEEMGIAATSPWVVEKEYEMPDGTVIIVGNERFRCPEAFFQPSFLGIESAGIHEAAYNAIEKTAHIHVDVRSELYSNMVMAGPGTLFPGIGDRIHREMASLVPTRTIMVVEPPERAYSVWMGASLHAVYFADSIAWIYREEYCAVNGNCDVSGPPPPLASTTSTGPLSTVIGTTEKQSAEDSESSDEDSSDEPIVDESISNDSNSDSLDEENSSFMSKMFDIVSGSATGDLVDDETEMLILNIWALLAIIVVCNIALCCWYYWDRKMKITTEQNMNIDRHLQLNL
eukprot:222915_1